MVQPEVSSKYLYIQHGSVVGPSPAPGITIFAALAPVETVQHLNNLHSTIIMTLQKNLILNQVRLREKKLLRKIKNGNKMSKKETEYKNVRRV